MTPRRTYSEEDLTAYLDGEASEDLARAIEADVGDDADLATRVANLHVPKDALRAAFDRQLPLAPHMPELPEVQADITPNRWTGFVPGLGAGLAAGLAIAVFTGLGDPEPEEPGWLDVVANYQTLYVPETLQAPKPAGPGGPGDGPGGPGGPGGGYTADLAGLSRVVGVDLTPLRKIEGLKFHRAQQLGFNGKPLIQIAYSLPDGTPVAICIMTSESPMRAPRASTLEGMSAADWTTGAHGILIIGGNEQETIDSIAAQVRPLI